MVEVLHQLIGSWTTAFRWPWCFLLIFGVGVGWGGDGYVRWTCTHGGCYATVLLVSVDTCWMLRHNASWWGWDGYVRWTCTHGGCYATVLLVSVDTCSMLRHNAWWWGGDGYVRWTCTHGGCYATVLLVSVDKCSLLRHNAWWWGGDDYVRWTCTHGGCYATVLLVSVDTCSMLRHNASWWGCGGVGMVTFGELAHMVDATQLCCLCPWTHAGCYATMHHDGVGMVTFGELAHMVDATQLCCLCPWTHARCYATMPHGGDGDGYVRWTCTHGGCYAVTSSRSENMSGSSSFRFRENPKSTSFAKAKCPFLSFCL